MFDHILIILLMIKAMSFRMDVLGPHGVPVVNKIIFVRNYNFSDFLKLLTAGKNNLRP